MHGVSAADCWLACRKSEFYTPPSNSFAAGRAGAKSDIFTHVFSRLFYLERVRALNIQFFFPEIFEEK
jgi:hypothetical protein